MLLSSPNCESCVYEYWAKFSSKKFEADFSKCVNCWQFVSSEIAKPLPGAGFGTFEAKSTRCSAAKVRRRQPPDEPTKTQVLLSAGVPPALTQQNWVVLLCSGCAGPARPWGWGSLRSGRGLSGAPGPRSAARPRPAPPCGAPSPLGRLGAVVGPSVPGASAPLRRALCNVGMNGISTQPLNPSAPISADTRPKQPCREGGCSSSILDKDKAGALVTLLLLSVPAPARSIRFCRTSPSKAGNSWRRSWSPPYRCDSGGAAHAHNCPQSAPTGPRRIFSSANGHPRSGAF